MAEPAVVKALGRLEPAGGVVNIGVPPGDRVAEVRVAEGSVVSAGQPLARLDSYTDRLAARDLAVTQRDEALARRQAILLSGQKQLAEAELRRRQVRDMEPLDIKALEDKVALLEQQRDAALKNLERFQSLRTSSIPQQQMEQQQLLVAQAGAELKATQSQLAKARRGHEYNLQLADAQIATLTASLERALKEVPERSLDRNVASTEEQLRRAEVCAPPMPERMVVLKVLTRPGEMVGNQPLFRLGDTGHMYAIAEVYETDAHRVHPGQAVRIRSRALDEVLRKALGQDYLTGTVEQVGGIVARNVVMDLSPAADADRRVVEVRIRLDRSDLVAKYVNLQVEVAIEVKEGAGQ